MTTGFCRAAGPRTVWCQSGTCARRDAVLQDRELPSGPAAFDVRNPATDAVIASLPDATPPEALEAVARADPAGGDWADTPRQRADLLRGSYDLLIQHAEEIALLITREMGKPLAAARRGRLRQRLRAWDAEEAVCVRGATCGTSPLAAPLC